MAAGRIDLGFAQRVKALACTAPLHDLDARKAQVQTADFTVYQMSELALHAIDLVTLAMDFDTGADPQQVIAGVAEHAAQQAPERSENEHHKVARWVLENMINVGSADRGFRALYGLTTGDGVYRTHAYDFKLLEEVPGADGEIYLRATNEAVNVLVGALEVDIESAQIAADLRLDTLIRRGRLSDAQAAAQTARYRTIQYGEMLRQKLEATGRDVRSVDWLTEMPKFLGEVLEHIEARYKAENSILLNITDIRDAADTPDRKRQAAQLVEIVRECLRRHGQLQTAVQLAGSRFRTEQDRQTFTPTRADATLDVYAQLLVPSLRASVVTADAVLDAFFVRSVGPIVPPAVQLSDLWRGLITPLSERDVLGSEVTEPELDDIEPEPPFPKECYELLEKLLTFDTDTPRRLSELLEKARKVHSSLPLLVVIRVLALAAQEIQAAVLHGATNVLIAVDDGTPLRDLEFAGSDLIVARAALTPNIKEDAA